jgi:hypothetical protein
MNGFFGPNMVYNSVGLVWLLDLCPKTIFKGRFMLNKAYHHQFHLFPLKVRVGQYIEICEPPIES